MGSVAGQTRQLADDLWVLDTLFQGESGVIASYLLTGPDGHALVDVGSAATIPALLAAIRAAGVQPEEIKHILLTHIHLDHAGATGALLPEMPEAEVYVHPIGVAHLVNPSKLIASATRIYGDRMEALWGRMEAVPASRMHALEDGSNLRVGSRTLRAVYTPGHAIHHMAYVDAARHEVFAGDAAGVRLQGIDYTRPPTPPPDLHLEDWAASIQRLKAVRPEVLYLAHYGPTTAVARHLEALEQRLYGWGELLLPGIRQGQPDERLARTLAAVSDPELAAQAPEHSEDAIRRYEVATNYLMSAQGYVRYYRKHHPELLAE